LVDSVRPQLAQERIAMCGMCTSVTPGEPQLVLGKDRAFTYDYVFDTFSDQESVYNSCVHSLVESCLNGYNATILAYGQTGSGKTYTMGTGFDVRVPAEEQGIIPRAVAHLFKAIDIRKKQAEDKNETPPEFKMAAQFMELYNEEIYDLFDVTREPGKRSNVKIHEDSKGGIYTVGVTSQDVRSQEETIKVLQRGALSRTTASTCMNAQSSRSHAIFSIIIEQQRVVRMSCESVDGIEQLPEVTEFDFETLRAKFHFVDLAGSERLKRTGATGDRAKEGISINCGLLALGNVISALGDVTRKASHVPYRDSKLTRLLQDSLGGNSKTLMIACVSPTDRDFMETLNTLKYANRTRNIKNKVVVNQDKASQVIMQLRQKIQQLQVELNEFKQGKLLAGKNGAVIMNDLHHENTMLKSESDKLRLRLKAAHETINTQSERLVELQAQVAVYKINGDDGQAAGEESQVESMIKGYLKEIEDLRGQLLQSESLAHHQPPSPFRRLSGDQPNMTAIRDTPSVMSPLSPSLRMFQWDTLKPDNLESILTEAKKDVEKDMVKLKEKENKLKGMGKQQDSMSEEANSSDDEFESAEGGESAEEDEDHSSGSEDTEQPAKNTEGDIAELSNEISIKEKLVFQLEHSKRQLETMKDQYEQKMATLQERIKRTEAERDQVLDNLTNSEQAAEDVKQRVKDQYESRLLTLQKEMRQLKAAKKQHQALLRENAQNEQQLKVLKNDLQEMKKQKVQLMRKLREESTLSKQLDAKRNKEIAQLKKQQRRSEHVIKNLEADQKKRDIVLQRRNEEIAVLRRQRNVDQGRVSQSQQQPRQPQAHSVIRASTASAAMACGPERKVQIQEQKRDRKPSSLFSSVGSRRKWRRIDSMISEVIVQKQTIGTLEDDMDRWIQERQRLHHELEENKRKQEEARDSEVSDAFISDLMEQYESLSSNLDYADQNIQDRESDIMALMDAKGDGESAVLTGLIKNCSASEAKYILERCVNSNVDVGVQLGRERTEKHQLEEQIKALEQQLKKQEELLLQQTGRWASEIHSLPTAELESLMNKLSDESPSQPENSSPDVCMHACLNKLINYYTDVVCKSWPTHTVNRHVKLCTD
jgi:kinesin family protein 4/21/27